jgi:hypothetical protein
VEPYEVSSVSEACRGISLAPTMTSSISTTRARSSLISAAWQEATRMAGDIIKDIDGKLRPGHDWKLEVEDEFKNVLWALHVKAEQPK